MSIDGAFNNFTVGVGGEGRSDPLDLSVCASASLARAPYLCREMRPKIKKQRLSSSVALNPKKIDGHFALSHCFCHERQILVQQCQKTLNGAKYWKLTLQ
eukprot:GEMP01026758.1.p3 GENE.GEMP01026758.1~~GEMP01026758.1.p3  ORF type:complete len:100 (-),score=5.89 GEMP01026758.1:1856-2155(-)